MAVAFFGLWDSADGSTLSRTTFRRKISLQISQWAAEDASIAFMLNADSQQLAPVSDKTSKAIFVNDQKSIRGIGLSSFSRFRWLSSFWKLDIFFNGKQRRSRKREIAAFRNIVSRIGNLSRYEH